MAIFSKSGLGGAFLIAIHVIVAVMWMGLLWFFNFVQTPAHAQMMDGAAGATTRSTSSRGAQLWWFRWAAVATVT